MKYPIYVSKYAVIKKHVYLSLTGEEGKRCYFLIKYLNTFMYDHTLHPRRKRFWRYCVQTFSTEKILKLHFKDCFEINGRQRFQMTKKVEYVKLKNFDRKIKSPFMINADFETILVPENDGEQNPEESNTNEY